ncbi:MAG TPA: hypothetical protein VG755_19705 [Nannocystaceae bacterium]|nr:hypothetical protein [Nannocystaceae bacterium]
MRGDAGVPLLEVDAGTSALRIDTHPDDDSALGSFGVSLASGNMAAGLAADAEVFFFRWTHPSIVASIQRVRMWAGGIAEFTAGRYRFELLLARGWSSHSASGTTASMTGDSGKKRVGSASSQVAAIEIASTAALTAGTKAIDAQGVGSVGGSTRGFGSFAEKLITPSGELFRYGGEAHAIVLRRNEGLVLTATVPASGTWRFGVDVEWCELAV